MLLTLVFGALGESYLPGKIIVSGDHERSSFMRDLVD